MYRDKNHSELKTNSHIFRLIFFQKFLFFVKTFIIILQLHFYIFKIIFKLRENEEGGNQQTPPMEGKHIFSSILEL